MGICIIVLAEFNQFAGQPGSLTHIILAVTISLLFLICTFLLSVAFNKLNKIWYYTSTVIGIAFLLAGSGFLIISKAFEGAYERGVVLLVLAWCCALGYQMIKYSRNPGSEFDREA